VDDEEGYTPECPYYCAGKVRVSLSLFILMAIFQMNLG